MSDTADHPAPHQTLARPDGEEIAYLRNRAKKPAGKAGLVWMGGFKSDMAGTKALALAEWAVRADRDLLRFDYFGHGQSSGTFTDGTIGRWREDALAAFDELTEGPQVIVGSSMGGWMALLTALARPERVKALVLIAPAPDFTQELMWKGFSDDIKATLKRDGIYREPSDFDEPYEITLKLIEESAAHLLLGGPIAINVPVRVMQGMRDESVPWLHAMRLVEALTSEDVEVHLSKAGDHRLSTPDDIARLMEVLGDVLRQVEG
jgi:pimeloyl-ACP methyl ester carboxylesterase